MRTLALLVSITLSATFASAQGNAELSQVQTVYVMPMANGFDQYLANRLREVTQLRVVTDAMRADAIFTDRIGAAFESRLEDMEAEAAEKAHQAEPKDKDATGSNEMKLAPKVVSNIGRGRGTYFLVHRGSRIVLWSIFSKPKDMEPKTLDRNAERVVMEFRKALAGK
jgi:hypothetical protein